jgi:hypothetical protein
MPIQYLTDESGERTAAVVPIEEWERLQERLEFAAETLSAEKAAELDADWHAYKSGEDAGIALDDLEQELLRDRAD